jgi:hypothetical protein
VQIRPLCRGRQRPLERRLRAALLGRQVAHELQQREGVALPALDDAVDHRRRQLAAEPSREQGSGVRRVERAESELLGLGETVVGFGRDHQRDPVDP